MKLVNWGVWAPTHGASHFSSLILELPGFQVSSLAVPVLLAQQISDSKRIMAAFRSRAAANNICYGAESMRYLGTATFMPKENVHFEEVQKTSQQKPTKLNIKKSILGEGKCVGDGEKENKDIVSELAAHYPLRKRFQSTWAYFGMTFFYWHIEFQANYNT